MNDSDVAAQLAELMSNILHEQVDANAPDARLVEDYGANSMDVVDIVERVERRFDAKITNNELGILLTFGDVLTLVRQRLPSNRGASGDAER